MKIISLVFSFTFCSICLAYCQGSNKKTDLTLMSYNIYHGELPYQLGNSNVGMIADLINRTEPDFVALQEVDSMTNRTREFNDGIRIDLVKNWAEQTGMQGFFAKAIDFSDGGYGEGVLSKYPAEMKSVTLPSPKGGEGRSMAVATVELENGQKFSFGATHLCHEFEENRTAQVEAIIDYFKNSDHAVAIAGDFNFESDEEGYALLQLKFMDAARDFGKPGNTYSSKEPKIRIDYIWLSKNQNWKIKEVAVIPVDYSDHMPLTVKVEF